MMSFWVVLLLTFQGFHLNAEPSQETVSKSLQLELIYLQRETRRLEALIEEGEVRKKRDYLKLTEHNQKLKADIAVKERRVRGFETELKTLRDQKQSLEKEQNVITEIQGQPLNSLKDSQKSHRPVNRVLSDGSGEVVASEVFTYGDFLAVFSDGTPAVPTDQSDVFAEAESLTLVSSLTREYQTGQSRSWADFLAGAGPIGWVILLLGFIVAAALFWRVLIVLKAFHLADQVSDVQLKRFQLFIPVAAAVAPLLGLLGTVTGMIETFSMMTTHGAGDPQMLSGGISEALITTQLGLVVAIPALFFGQIINGHARQLLLKKKRSLA